jgi:hypothetical protein
MRFQVLDLPVALRRAARLGASGLSLAMGAGLLSACPVDSRTLIVTEGSGGQQNHSSSGGVLDSGSAGSAPSAGGWGDASAGGQAGDGAAGEGGAVTRTFPDGCADLDQDGTSDCTETLVQNPAFALDVSNWTAQTDGAISWDARDLLGAPSSGSALVTSSSVLDSPGDSIVAAEQCVAVRSGAILAVFANALIGSGQVAGRAAISLWFFAADDCPGNGFSDVYETAEQFEAGQVLTLQGSKVVAAGVRSVRVRLGVIKPNSAKTFAVRFDNLLLREE